MNQILGNPKELPTLAAERIREMIIKDRIRSGDRIPSEAELMHIFSVSRSTIREAIKILVAENVVTIRRGKGTFVSDQPGISKDPLGLHFSDQKKLLYNLLETRMMVEPQIAMLATRRATKENIQALEAVVREFQASSLTKVQHAHLDIRFHTAVAKCTQNDVLYRFLPIICESIREGNYNTVTTQVSISRSLSSHNRIFEAIKNRDSALAMQETGKHIQQAAIDANIILGGIGL